MKYQWRREAEKQVRQAIRYCGKSFGRRAAEEFLGNIDHQLILLAANPQMGPIEPLFKSKRRTYRSLVIHKHYKLLYYIDDVKETLYIVALWDTRREPAKLTHSSTLLP